MTHGESISKARQQKLLSKMPISPRKGSSRTGSIVECIFCDILAGKVKANIIYEDERCVALPDLHSQAPLHLLIIPREHIPSIADAQGEEIISHLIHVANKLAQTEGISSRGYRLVVNCGPEGGQVVPHLHLHLLGGQRLGNRLG